MSLEDAFAIVKHVFASRPVFLARGIHPTNIILLQVVKPLTTLCMIILLRWSTQLTLMIWYEKTCASFAWRVRRSWYWPLTYREAKAIGKATKTKSYIVYKSSQQTITIIKNYLLLCSSVSQSHGTSSSTLMSAVSNYTNKLQNSVFKEALWRRVLMPLFTHSDSSQFDMGCGCGQVSIYSWYFSSTQLPFFQWKIQENAWWNERYTMCDFI